MGDTYEVSYDSIFVLLRGKDAEIEKQKELKLEQFWNAKKWQEETLKLRAEIERLTYSENLHKELSIKRFKENQESKEEIKIKNYVAKHKKKLSDQEERELLKKLIFKCPFSATRFLEEYDNLQKEDKK